ncbi:MAG: hypothetical protein IJ136_06440 [Erysipelotrichaceae bacterium]|nr:hypothetical protein [Erysipelotrichaceae bacterium]
MAELSKKELIRHRVHGEEIVISILPKEKYIELNENTLKISDFRQRGFNHSVDWAVVLKVLFAILAVGNDYNVPQIMEIANVGDKTVSRSASIVKNCFANVDYKKHTRIINGEWHTEFVHLDIPAFGFSRK